MKDKSNYKSPGNILNALFWGGNAYQVTKSVIDITSGSRLQNNGIDNGTSEGCSKSNESNTQTINGHVTLSFGIRTCSHIIFMKSYIILVCGETS